ncbi:MAG: peptidoglycan-binding domain-containing protein, partial [Terriglobales bacterium]
MLRSDQIRGWRRVGLCGLLCVAVHGFATAQTAASTPPNKPAKTTTSHTAKAKHPTTAHTATKHSSSSTSAQKSKSARGKKGSKQVAKKRGQQVIDSERAREIQTALIREHYMQGEPSGSWDAATQAAMQRFQADQGWQSKTTPDSRALIKLGLGPSHDHLLNPENAMTTAPAESPAGDPVPKNGAPPGPAPINTPHRK